MLNALKLHLLHLNNNSTFFHFKCIWRYCLQSGFHFIWISMFKLSFLCSRPMAVKSWMCYTVPQPAGWPPYRQLSISKENAQHWVHQKKYQDPVAQSICPSRSRVWSLNPRVVIGWKEWFNIDPKSQLVSGIWPRRLLQCSIANWNILSDFSSPGSYHQWGRVGFSNAEEGYNPISVMTQFKKCTHIPSNL